MACRLAFLFPGQGSQKVGMGQALLRRVSRGARRVRGGRRGARAIRCRSCASKGPEAELTLTANAQPAILTTSVAALRVLAKRDRTCGRTSWPVTRWASTRALVAAGALRLADAVRLVHLRGKFMQEAVPAGRGRDGGHPGSVRRRRRGRLRRGARQAPRSSAPANLNGGGQIVIAGHKAAVDRAARAAQGARRQARDAAGGERARSIARSMQPAAERLAAELARRRGSARPAVPVVTNVEAAPNQDAARVARPAGAAGHRARCAGRSRCSGSPRWA